MPVSEALARCPELLPEHMLVKYRIVNKCSSQKTTGLLTVIPAGILGRHSQADILRLALQSNSDTNTQHLRFKKLQMQISRALSGE